MKKIILKSLLAFLGFGISFVDAADLSSSECSGWQNGYIFLVKDKLSDFEISYVGGTVHEGGYTGLIKDMGNDNYLYYSGIDDNGLKAVITSPIGPNSNVYMLVRNEKGEYVDIYKSCENCNLNMLEQIEQNDWFSLLSGTYHNSKTGYKLEINFVEDGKFRFKDNNHDELFSFERVNHFAAPVIKLSDGTSFYLIQTIDGLDLYKAELNDGYIEKGALLENLVRDGDTPRWQFTRSELLTTGMLSKIPTELLRYVRNEIFARYGRSFQNKELNKYFTKMPWYETSSTFKDSNLSAIEGMNVSIILDEEKHRKESN